MKQIKGAFS